MDGLLIHGGPPLRGTVRINGSYEAALATIAASLVAEGKTTLRRIPRLPRVDAMVRLLEELGCDVHWGKPGGSEADAPAADQTLTIQVHNESRSEAPHDPVKACSAGMLLLGPLLAKRGRAVIPIPGASAIGDRAVAPYVPVMRMLSRFGVRLSTEYGNLVAQRHGRLRGCRLAMEAEGPHRIATIVAMCAAALAEGQSVIDEAASDPEVVDCADMLNAMGARIGGQGTGQIRIDGVDTLVGCEHTLIPDRIECGLFMTAAAITGGEVELGPCNPGHLGAVVGCLADVGVRFVARDDGVFVSCPKGLGAVDVTAERYPGFPTDLQPLVTALLCLARGVSRVTDTVYPERLSHVEPLNRMGAKIGRDGHAAVVHGVEHLHGTALVSGDTQAGAALVVAGLAARGRTQVDRVYHLERRYWALDRRLQALGAMIERIGLSPLATGGGGRT